MRAPMPYRAQQAYSDQTDEQDPTLQPDKANANDNGSSTPPGPQPYKTPQDQAASAPAGATASGGGQKPTFSQLQDAGEARPPRPEPSVTNPNDVGPVGAPTPFNPNNFTAPGAGGLIPPPTGAFAAATKPVPTSGMLGALPHYAAPSIPSPTATPINPAAQKFSLPGAGVGTNAPGSGGMPQPPSLGVPQPTPQVGASPAPIDTLSGAWTPPTSAPGSAPLIPTTAGGTMTPQGDAANSFRGYQSSEGGGFGGFDAKTYYAAHPELDPATGLDKGLATSLESMKHINDPSVLQKRNDGIMAGTFVPGVGSASVNNTTGEIINPATGAVIGNANDPNLDMAALKKAMGSTGDFNIDASGKAVAGPAPAAPAPVNPQAGNWTAKDPAQQAAGLAAQGLSPTAAPAPPLATNPPPIAAPTAMPTPTVTPIAPAAGAPTPPPKVNNAPPAAPAAPPAAPVAPPPPPPPPPAQPGSQSAVPTPYTPPATAPAVPGTTPPAAAPATDPNQSGSAGVAKGQLGGGAGDATDVLSQILGGVSGQGAGSAVADATQKKILDQLQNPNAYNSDAVKNEYNTLGENIDDQYALQQKDLEEEMARRGLSTSTIGAGRLSDLHIGQRSAKAQLASDLATKMATSQNAANGQAISQGTQGATAAQGNQQSWLGQLMGYGQQGFNNDMAVNQANNDQNNQWQQFLMQMLNAGYGSAGA